MKRIKRRPFTEEIWQFLRKDRVGIGDIAYEEPFSPLEWDEIFRDYGLGGLRSSILLKSGQRKSGKLKGLDKNKGTLELEDGEQLALQDIKSIEKE